MKDKISIRIPKLAPPIHHSDALLLMGSCFTDHMSKRLHSYGIACMSNPSGTLYNPLGIVGSLRRYLNNEPVCQEQLVLQSELYHHWDFHTQFSHTQPLQVVAAINEQVAAAHSFLQRADWLILTLGSSFQYQLVQGGYGVNNCHRMPASEFAKVLLTTEQMAAAMSGIMDELRLLRPNLQVLLTVSPVRHIKDGVVQNNRSKARLVELVHQLCEQHSFVHYFPAYELVVDVLRGYRYYDVDLVHPNYAATQYVWEQLMENCFHPASQKVFAALNDLNIAFGHRAQHEDTQAHRQFMRTYAQKSAVLASAHPELDLSRYLHYFSIAQK